MTKDWYFVRQTRRGSGARIEQITQSFDYVLAQAHEADAAHETIRVRPAIEATEAELKRLAEEPALTEAV